MTGFPFLLLALGMSCVCYAFKLRIFLSDLSAYRRVVVSMGYGAIRERGKGVERSLRRRTKIS